MFGPLARSSTGCRKNQKTACKNHRCPFGKKEEERIALANGIIRHPSKPVASPSMFNPTSPIKRTWQEASQASGRGFQAEAHHRLGIPAGPQSGDSRRPSFGEILQASTDSIGLKLSIECFSINLCDSSNDLLYSTETDTTSRARSSRKGHEKARNLTRDHPV